MLNFLTLIFLHPVVLFAMIEWLLAIFFVCFMSGPAQFSTTCVCSDILCMFLQSKTSIHRLSRQKKSSATAGCEIHPTARPKWWGKTRWFFFSISSLQMGSEKKSNAGKKQREGGGMEGYVRERYFRAGCCWWWEFGWIGGGKLRVAEATLWEKEREVPR